MPARPREPLHTLLPEFPWDTLVDATALAQRHPQGFVDLSIGAPIDEVAPGTQLALAEAAAEPGYPPTTGTPELLTACVDWLSRVHSVTGLDADFIQPVVGTKEAVASLPWILGIGPGHKVVIPEIAYPTYEVAARAAGADILRADSLTQLGPLTPSLMFINTPSNPTGAVLGIDHLRKVVSWAQHRGVIVVSDECYLGLGWYDNNPPVSILDPRVNEGNLTGLLALHSLSKSHNLASYRFGFFAGDPALITEIAQARKHLGAMVPWAVQQAATVALADDVSAQIQRLRYARRRAVLMRSLIEAGFRIDHSEAGLYLWATRDEPGRESVMWLAERGILAAPGEFYGVRGENYVRLSLTASDEDILAAADRIAAE
ncbi:succinyldiaminopimelate transaminase [Corynebacterium epidermidicanis]|uniref:Succinyldiaminopimelate aminotransferase apoenzyme n=1 Tax=Corynebacterium epidermidicanis TaxID=1050174 RepID=A0A0G3GNT3_9CORY|nr:succinyldiaminopimelate transaminase [Corynebacterium epidermidicanis]AKK02809.1 succinyldiaminopimelate aminotransferase apoenzyme [Corynebacterium epidermidicanis]